MTPAVIVVPGIMGSELRDGDAVVWPGSPSELVLPYKHMESLLKPDLKVTGLIRRFSISPQYQELIDTLEKCGFKEFGSPSTLLAFAYDWRKDNAIAATELAKAVDDMAASLGPNAEISLLAHSMGGLVCRCYLESGMYLSRPGFLSVKRLIMMGTPNRGSPMALGAALGQERRLFLNADQVKELANNVNFPAVYQLLPPAGEPFAWNRALHKRFDAVDIFEAKVAKRLGLVAANLASAGQFHAMLDLNKRPKDIRYFCFVGTHYSTTNAMQLTLEQKGRPSVLKDDCKDGGDGTVPIWSASQSGLQMQPVGGEHGELYKTTRLKSTLAALLDSEVLLLASGTVPEISVRQKVVLTDDTVEVIIEMPRNTASISGTLQFRRLIDSTGVAAAAPVTTQFPLSYQGPPVDHLALLIKAPEYAGAYEVGYVPSTGTGAVAITELFVQKRA
jgi:pimeloyl-ACP methyl ester carboxylesterase